MYSPRTTEVCPYALLHHSTVTLALLVPSQVTIDCSVFTGTFTLVSSQVDDLCLLACFPLPSGPGPVYQAVVGCRFGYLQLGRYWSRFRGIRGAGSRLSRSFWITGAQVTLPWLRWDLWARLADFSNRLLAFLQLSLFHVCLGQLWASFTWHNMGVPLCSAASFHCHSGIVSFQLGDH